MKSYREGPIDESDLYVSSTGRLESTHLSSSSTSLSSSESSLSETDELSRKPPIEGYLSSPGATECRQCPAGYACPDNADYSKNVQCSNGWYSIAGQMDCTACSLGHYCISIT